MNGQFVRFGVMGHVGHFRSPEGTLYRRAARVILRTSRGVEVGEIVTTAGHPFASGSGEIAVDSAGRSVAGEILRAMTVEDELLQARLDKHRTEAFEACVALLEERQLAATLVDVEQLFDGASIIFHFLGNVPVEVEDLTTRLAQTYESKAKVAQFAETLSEGCGPDCGTEQGGGVRFVR